MSETIHVYPEEDWIEHVTEGLGCPCHPEVQFIDPDTGLPYPGGGKLVIHEKVAGD